MQLTAELTANRKNLLYVTIFLDSYSRTATLRLHSIGNAD